MLRVSAITLGICLALGVGSSAAASTSPRAKAKMLLHTCLKAVNSVPIVALRANTPQVPRANRRAQAAFHKCGTTAPWLKLNTSKGAIHRAYNAWADLAFGIGDYMTYCENVAFGHTGKSILHKAQREIARGKREAKHALAEL